MQLYGHGVTKNFLSILETDLRRNAKNLIRLGVLLAFVSLFAALAVHRELWLGAAFFAGALLGGVIVGYAWGHFVNTYRYQASIREHWNRWMRYSISCVTVRECYAKVHGKRTSPSVLWASLFIAGLLLWHLVLGVLSLNETAPLWQPIALFSLDAGLVGFAVGVRWRESRWYREFLRSVNELLQEGTIGVWGVY